MWKTGSRAIAHRPDKKCEPRSLQAETSVIQYVDKLALPQVPARFSWHYRPHIPARNLETKPGDDETSLVATKNQSTAILARIRVGSRLCYVRPFKQVSGRWRNCFMARFFSFASVPFPLGRMLSFSDPKY